VAAITSGFATGAGASPIGFQTEITGASIINPVAIASDGNGNLYVADYYGSSGNIVEITPQGTVLATLGADGVYAQGLTVLNGDVFASASFGHLSDITAGLVGVFTHNVTIGSAFTGDLYLLHLNGLMDVIDPTTLITITSFSTAATAGANPLPGQFGVFGDGDVAVGAPNAVDVYNVSGTLVASYPTSVTQPGAVTVDGNGNIWVADLSGDLQEIENGQVQSLISNPGGLCRTIGLTSDTNGNIWMTDQCNNGGAGGIQEYVVAPRSTGDTLDPVFRVSVSAVGATSLRFTWHSTDDPGTQYVCSASNGATQTVTKNSCVLSGFNLHQTAAYPVSITARNEEGQSGPALLNVELQPGANR